MGTGNRHDLILRDELGGHGSGLGGLRRVVLGDQLDLSAQNAAVGVDLLNGHLLAVDGILSKDRLTAGQGINGTDLDGFVLFAAAAEGRSQTQCQYRRKNP